MVDALRREVQDRLDLVDDITRQGAPETLLPLARAELHRLADSWRQLLSAHQPDDDGRCQGCPPGIRRRRWPCQVWFTAHDHLIGDALSVRTPHPVSPTPPEAARAPASPPRVTRPRDIPAPAAAPDDDASASGPADDQARSGPARGADPAPAVRLPVIYRVEVTGEQPAAASPPSLTELTLPPRAVVPVAYGLETDSSRIHRAPIGGRPTALPWHSPQEE